MSQLMSQVSDLVAAKSMELSRGPSKRRMSFMNQESSPKFAVEDIEAEVLDCAARLVDLGLAINVDNVAPSYEIAADVYPQEGVAPGVEDCTVY